MKIENNRALAAEKKAYAMPSVIMTQMVQSSTILMGSPGKGIGAGSGGGTTGDIDGGGGSISGD